MSPSKVKSAIAQYINTAETTLKIITGSYDGTGTYGVDNPTTINLPYKEKFLIVYGDGKGGDFWRDQILIWIPHTNSYAPAGYSIAVIGNSDVGSSSTSGRAVCYVKRVGNNLQWYNTQGADYQMNYNQSPRPTHYSWVALCENKSPI